MEQQCKSCSKVWTLAEMIETSTMLSLYPVQSEAKFCPYCGSNQNGQPAEVARLQARVEAMREALAELIRAADPQTNLSMIPLLDALSLARATLARAGGE